MFFTITGARIKKRALNRDKKSLAYFQHIQGQPSHCDSVVFHRVSSSAFPTHFPIHQHHRAPRRTPPALFFINIRCFSIYSETNVEEFSVSVCLSTRKSRRSRNKEEKEAVSWEENKKNPQNKKKIRC